MEPNMSARELLIGYLGESPGGCGSILLKSWIERRTGERYRVKDFDAWLRSLSAEGSLRFVDYGAGGVVYAVDDPYPRVRVGRRSS